MMRLIEDILKYVDFKKLYNKPFNLLKSKGFSSKVIVSKCKCRCRSEFMSYISIVIDKHRLRM